LGSGVRRQDEIRHVFTAPAASVSPQDSSGCPRRGRRVL